MRRLLFWASAGTIAYTLAGFPLLAYLRARLAPRPHRSEPITPSISFIIAAHNEAESIGDKLERVTTLDYPTECIEVIVASDGSDDATNEIVASFPDRRVRLLALERGGKAAALNRAAELASGEILVFSDANSMPAPQALRALVAPFADAKVGGVAGDQRYLDARTGTPKAEDSYWGFDRRLKAWESAAGNVISSTGALHAIRRELFREVPAGITDDFYLSTGVIRAGRRLVFAPDAAAYEPAAPSAGAEYARKLRVATRILRTELLLRDLANPLRHGFYAVQFVSHKPMRQLLGLPLIGLALASWTLRGSGALYRIAAVSQALFYGLGVIGIISRRAAWGQHRLLALPAYFCLAYAAQLVALWNVLTGRRVDRWQRPR